jgi:hypothetical protein
VDGSRGRECRLKGLSQGGNHELVGKAIAPIVAATKDPDSTRISGPNEGAAVSAKVNEGTGPKWPIILVGANARDTVGGLMPLSLQPPVTIAQRTAQPKSW